MKRGSSQVGLFSRTSDETGKTIAEAPYLIIDANTGKTMTTLTSKFAEYNDWYIFFPDSKRLLLVDFVKTVLDKTLAPGKVCIVDADTGKEMAVIEGNFYDVCLSGDGSKLITFTRSFKTRQNEALVYDTAGFKNAGQVDDCYGSILSYNGKKLFGNYTIADTQTGQITKIGNIDFIPPSLPPPVGRERSSCSIIMLSPDERYIFTEESERDGNFYHFFYAIRSTSSYEIIARKEMPSPLSDISGERTFRKFSPDGKKIVSVIKGKKISVWDWQRDTGARPVQSRTQKPIDSGGKKTSNGIKPSLPQPDPAPNPSPMPRPQDIFSRALEKNSAWKVEVREADGMVIVSVDSRRQTKDKEPVMVFLADFDSFSKGNVKFAACPDDWKPFNNTKPNTASYSRPINPQFRGKRYLLLCNPRDAVRQCADWNEKLQYVRNERELYDSVLAEAEDWCKFDGKPPRKR